MTPDPKQVEMHAAQWRGVSRRAMVIGAVASIIVITMALIDRRAAAQSWLIAETYWWSISLGALLILGVHHLTGGAWGAAIRSELESAVQALWVPALGFFGIALSLGVLYQWATTEGQAGLPGNRAMWLSPVGFIVRGVIYFICWGVFAAALLRRGAGDRGQTLSRWEYRRRGPAAAGLIVLFLTGTLAAVDWLMSLDSHWYSTGFGLCVLAGCALGGYATCITTIGLDPGGAKMLLGAPSQLRRDLGNFMIVFVIFWAYVSFMQYLIIWSGDLHDDAPWYIARAHGFWEVVGVGLIVLHFAVPFLVLLSDRVRESPRAMAGVGLGLLVFHLCEVLWIIAPSLRRAGQIPVHWIDPVCVIAMGGWWVALFAKGMQTRPRTEPAMNWRVELQAEAPTS